MPHLAIADGRGRGCSALQRLQACDNDLNDNEDHLHNIVEAAILALRKVSIKGSPNWNKPEQKLAPFMDPLGS